MCCFFQPRQKAPHHEYVIFSLKSQASRGYCCLCYDPLPTVSSRKIDLVVDSWYLNFVLRDEHLHRLLQQFPVLAVPLKSLNVTPLPTSLCQVSSLEEHGRWYNSTYRVRINILLRVFVPVNPVEAHHVGTIHHVPCRAPLFVPKRSSSPLSRVETSPSMWLFLL